MANFDSQWAFGAFDAPTTMTATTYTLPHLSDPTSTVFSGTGFTYSGDVPTGGTITSISLVVNDGGGVLATITNINISLADFGDLLTDIYAMRALIPWEGVLSEHAHSPGKHRRHVHRHRWQRFRRYCARQLYRDSHQHPAHRLRRNHCSGRCGD
jgi:hypothetical protein